MTIYVGSIIWWKISGTQMETPDYSTFSVDATVCVAWPFIKLLAMLFHLLWPGKWHLLFGENIFSRYIAVYVIIYATFSLFPANLILFSFVIILYARFFWTYFRRDDWGSGTYVKPWPMSWLVVRPANIQYADTGGRCNDGAGMYRQD